MLSSNNNNNNTFAKDQLFAALEFDRIAINADTIDKAKKNDGVALWKIGLGYEQKKKHSKALAWYRLSENQNCSEAYTNIGLLHEEGKGVPQNKITAFEYFLKAAGNKNTYAMLNIGLMFRDGSGIIANKYKALEWFYKSGIRPEEVRKLNEKGFFLTEEDENKTLYQLINETEDTLRERRKKRENLLKEEVQRLRQSESSKEKEITNTRKEITKILKENEELQTIPQQKQQQIELLEQKNQKSTSENQVLKQLTNTLEEQLKDKKETTDITIETFRILVESKNNEIDSLKNYIQILLEKEKEHRRLCNLEKEFEEFRRQKAENRSQVNNDNDSGIASTNSDNTTGAIISDDRELNNQAIQNDAPSNNINDNIKIKTENETEESDTITCKSVMKKRKTRHSG